jgi:hypothetical protein
MSATAFCRAMFEFDEPMIWDGERLTHSLPVATSEMSASLMGR